MVSGVIIAIINIGFCVINASSGAKLKVIALKHGREGNVHAYADVLRGPSLS